MKNLLVMIGLCFMYMHGYGQITILPPKVIIKDSAPIIRRKNPDGSYYFDKNRLQTEVNIAINPNQKIVFDVTVFTQGHEFFICDTLGNILYRQKKQSGVYISSSQNTYKHFVIYDKFNQEKNVTAGFNPVDNFHQDIAFGYNTMNVLVKISAELK